MGIGLARIIEQRSVVDQGQTAARRWNAIESVLVAHRLQTPRIVVEALGRGQVGAEILEQGQPLDAHVADLAHVVVGDADQVRGFAALRSRDELDHVLHVGNAFGVHRKVRMGVAKRLHGIEEYGFLARIRRVGVPDLDGAESRLRADQ